MRIAQTLKNDKRSKTKIDAVVHNTRVYLSIGNVHINLSEVEAKRVFRVISKSVAIQNTKKLHKAEEKALHPW